MKNVDSVKNPLLFTNSELALRLAEQGWKIFPCHFSGTRAKQPHIKGGFKKATNDIKQIAKWWRKWPNALIGFPPGPNGLLVVDQDVKGGTDGVAAWRKLSDAWKDAIATETPSGGLHDWYEAPMRTIGNGRGKLPKGIDIRCDHGYVCLGTLADGTCYAPEGEPDLYALLLALEDGEEWFRPLPADVLALLPEDGERQTPESKYRDPLHIAYSKGYEPVTALKALDGWQAPQEPGRSNSDDAFDWLAKAVVALCQILDLDAADLGDDHARNLADLALAADHDFMQHYDERGMGKLGYDIDQAFAWARREGIRSDAKAMQDFDRLAEQFKQTGHVEGRGGAERAESGDRTADDAAGFVKLLDALLDASPDEVTLDLKLRELAELPGAPGITALRKQYKSMARARRKQDREGGMAFPDEMPMTGAARVNSLNNIEAWLDESGLDIWYDEWAEAVRLGDRVFDDHDLRRITRDMHRDKLFVDKLVKQAVDTFAFERRAHPVKDWFEDAARGWDGRERLDYWLEDYCGAPANDAWRAVSRLVLVAVVGRVFCPGIKWDSVLTFIGAQGFNKSTACRVLAIRDEWYLEGFKLKWSMKEVIENTEGKLIWEYAEFSGHKAADQDELKDAVTRTADKARKAYGQYATERRRQGVIIGTSNEDTPLHDTTGNRRYWPLKLTGPIDTKGLAAELVQIYGEAVHAWREGEARYRSNGIMLPQEHWAYFGELQEAARMKVSLEERLEDALAGIDEGHIKLVTLFDLLDVRVHDKFAGRDIGRILERLGWEKRRLRVKGDSKQRFFVKGANCQNVEIMCVEGMKGKTLHAKKVR